MFIGKILKKERAARHKLIDLVEPEMRSIKAKLPEHLQADLEDYADHYVVEYDQVRQEIGKRWNSAANEQMLRSHHHE